MRGRKPKPENLKLLSEPRRVVGGSDPPECPDWLTGEAREEWERVVTELAARGLASRADRPSLEVYCSTYARWREAGDLLRGEGAFTVPTRQGVKTNPIYKAWMDMGDKLRMWSAEFGFSPAARSRISIPPPEGADEDEFAEFMSETPGEIDSEQVG